MCGYFCIGFTDFMLAGKIIYIIYNLYNFDYTNWFSPHDLNKNDSIILSYFKDA